MAEPMTPRRSRTFWPEPLEPGGLPQPLRQPRLPLTIAFFALAVVVLGIAATLVYAMRVEHRLGVLEEYVQGRGEFRDAEAARMEQEFQERLRQAQCDLLDQLPEGGLLERPRGKYRCGPGIPLSQLPPDEAERLRSQRTVPAPVVPAPSSAPAPAPALRDGADPTGAAPLPRPTPEPAPPTTSTESPSLLDLEPYTGPLCESVRVCA